MRRRVPKAYRLTGVLISVILAFSSASGAAKRGADGKYEKRTSSHFVLYQDVAIDETAGLRGSRRFEQELLKALEAAYDRLDARLGLRPGRPIIVVVHDARVYAQRFGGRFRFPSAGFYRGEVHVRGDVRVHMNLIETLHHELVHAAFHAELPSLILPAWFNEGVAEWFGARAMGRRSLTHGQAQYLATASRELGLFQLSELSAPSFGGLTSPAAHLAYIESQAFFEYLARRYSDRKLRDLCREFARSQDLARAFQKTFKTTLNNLETSFRKNLQANVSR